MNNTMKTKIIVTVAYALTAFGLFASVQKYTQKKEDILNTTPIVVDVSFNEDDPIFTNWVGSAEFKNIPRMTSEKISTEYAPGKTNHGNRTTLYVGNTFAGRTMDITKDVKTLEVFDIHDKMVVWTPDSSNEVYKCEYIDKALSNKCDKVSLSEIEPLSPSSTTSEIVDAVKKLARALGKAE